MTTLTNEQARSVIRRLLLHDGSHRRIIIELINRQFVESALQFFARVAEAKLQGLEVNSSDWYVTELLSNAPTSKKMGLWAGLGGKTIKNAYGSNAREIVIEASQDNLEHFRSLIEELIATGGPDIILTIKMHGVGVDLTIAESLLVINALAVMRHSMSGGTWAAVGVAVERPLMLTMCELFQVNEGNRRDAVHGEFHHQADFVLCNSEEVFPVEVKLTGSGNPENAKPVHAHKSSLLVSDQISDLAKTTLGEASIQWVELGRQDGYQRFGQVLESLGIPHKCPSDLSELDRILEELLPDTLP